MGPDSNTKYQIFVVVAAQVAMACWASGQQWRVLLPVAYLLGGAANCNLQLGMHEISHNLAFPFTTKRGMVLNRLLSLVANLPLGIPAAISFRKYHLEHHRYQGHDVMDVDVPCDWEGWFFCSPARKLLWCLLQPAFYALRPLATNPKPLLAWEAVNIVLQLAFDYGIYAIWGAKALMYLVGGTLLGMGVHPTAYHFISEHCVFVEGYETYSYYGWLNAIMYNVGYHNEHHDFPNVPGSRLHKVKELAPEFYDDLPFHDSWWTVYRDYIFRADINPFSRVKRSKLGLPAGSSYNDTNDTAKQAAGGSSCGGGGFYVNKTVVDMRQAVENNKKGGAKEDIKKAQ
jgi:sphingolipid delta-4 desaturase